VRILLVEDDLMLAGAVARALRQSAHAVDALASGDEADHYLTANEYDLVLLDVRLPKLDGFEVLRRLRQRRNQVPVLILTGASRPRTWSWVSTSAPTTTSPSHSTCRNWRHGYAR
jgi:DNA-binding response OmpR family regulator